MLIRRELTLEEEVRVDLHCDFFASPKRGKILDNFPLRLNFDRADTGTRHQLISNLQWLGSR